MAIRELLGVEPRVESGAIKFGSDWPGLFLRGDDAASLSCQIARIIALIKNSSANTSILDRLAIAELIALKDLIDNDVINKDIVGIAPLNR